MDSGTPQSTETVKGRAGRKALPPDQKQIKKTVSMVDPDWEFISLWWGGDEEMNTPSHHLRELVADMRSRRPKGPRVFGFDGKRPRHVMPGGKLSKFAEKSQEGLTNKEAAALIVQRYIAEHPEEFE